MSRVDPLTPAWLMRLSGAGLVALGVAGYLLRAAGVDPGQRYFTLTGGENAAHVAAGLFAAGAALLFSRRPKALKWLVVLIGIAALFTGFYGLLGDAGAGDDRGLGLFGRWVFTGLPGPADNVLHVLYAAWALVAAFRGAPRPGLAVPRGQPASLR